MRVFTTILKVLPLLLLLSQGCKTKTKVVASCGDGFLDPGETCDSGTLPVSSCQELGYYVQNGDLTCNDDCTLNQSACSLSCGDGQIQTEFGERCEDQNLSGETCSTLGLGGGTLSCSADCRFDISGCEVQAVCGDGTISSPFEHCDGANLNGQTCLTLGFHGGTLGCDLFDCVFDTSSCATFGRCGDGVIQSTYGEECEGTELQGESCEHLGYYGGLLRCGEDCRLDVTPCAEVGRCGDGIIQDGQQETCDGTNLGTTTCDTLGYYEGDLACGQDCLFVTDNCVGRCGDGIIQSEHLETCDGADLGSATCLGFGHFGGEPTCSPQCLVQQDTCADVVDISGGYQHTCAALSDGTARCWGAGGGRLGDGTSAESHVPVQVLGLTSATSVSAGYWHTCAVLSDGTARCWGVSDGPTPVQVSGLNTITAISCGENHTCALLSDGTVRCWGDNSSGELGNASNNTTNTPVQVTGLTNAISVAAGYDHSCAVLTDGTARCWGNNLFGQLGDGTTTNSNVPVIVSSLTQVSRISCGAEHTCAVLAGDTVSCWGNNTNGRLGADLYDTSYPSPVAVANLTGAVTVSAGYQHTCVTTSGGIPWCWGSNYAGKLGDGTSTTRPTPVFVTGLTNATVITAGRNHTCAVLSSGLPRCWGYNNNGQLGNGTTTNSLIPIAVTP